MPHFGLMDETKMTQSDAALLRAKLHLRSGRDRLRQGKLSLGIVTLYDALVSAMRWYILSVERRRDLKLGDIDYLKTDEDIYSVFVRSGIFDHCFDFDRFEALTSAAPEQELSDVNPEDIIQQVERLMTRLGVMPFDEKSLPPETPSSSKEFSV